MRYLRRMYIEHSVCRTLICLLFWDVTQRIVVAADISGQPVGPIFKDQAFRNAWHLMVGRKCCAEMTVAIHLCCLTYKRTEDVIGTPVVYMKTIQCRNHTVPKPHNAKNTQCRNHTVPKPHSAKTTQYRNHTVPKPHNAETTQCQKHTVPKPHSAKTIQWQNHTVPKPHSTETTHCRNHTVPTLFYTFSTILPRKLQFFFFESEVFILGWFIHARNVETDYYDENRTHGT
jgi:hypothetical protein